jgi:hypothetical protein
MEGIIAARDLRQFYLPATHTYYDPHLVNGTLNFELLNFLQASRAKLGVGLEPFEAFLKLDWVFGKCYRKQSQAVAKLFREAAQHDGSFRAHGSDLLNAYPLLCHYVVHVEPRGRMDAECASMYAMCAELDEYVAVKKGYKPFNQAEWERASCAALELFVAAYGETKVKLKHHYRLHIPEQTRNCDGLVLDCFTTERKNESIKRQARHLFGGSAKCFEWALFTMNRMQYSRDIAEFALESKLLGAVEQDGSNEWATGLQHDGMQIHADDVVLCGDECALVRAVAANTEGRFFMVVHVVQSLRRDKSCSRWILVENSRVCWSGENRRRDGLHVAPCWRKDGGEFVASGRKNVYIYIYIHTYIYICVCCPLCCAVARMCKCVCPLCGCPQCEYGLRNK